MAPDLRTRFEREARAVSSLNHPHICVLHDVGHQDGTDDIVMELMRGMSKLKVAGAAWSGLLLDVAQRDHLGAVVFGDHRPAHADLDLARRSKLTRALAASGTVSRAKASS
jgi:hypothetical protein